MLGLNAVGSLIHPWSLVPKMYRGIHLKLVMLVQSEGRFPAAEIPQAVAVEHDPTARSSPVLDETIMNVGMDEKSTRLSIRPAQTTQRRKLHRGNLGLAAIWLRGAPKRLHGCC